MSRNTQLQLLAGDGHLEDLRQLLGASPTPDELNQALVNAVAYSQCAVAQFLISVGADLSACGNMAACEAVQNGELAGLSFAISNGVDVNTGAGLLLNASIEHAINSGSTHITAWLLEHGAARHLLSEGSWSLVLRFGSAQLRRLLQPE